MKKTRRKFSASFKAKVALEAIKEQSTLQELSSKHGIHSNQIVKWKKEFIENASVVFETKAQKEDKEDVETEKLYNKIGHMQIQIDFLKQVLGK